MPILANLKDVPPLRILRVDNRAVPRADTLVQDVHVEAVQMHRMAA